MADNIEEVNAKQWGDDTDVSSVAPSRMPPGLVRTFVPSAGNSGPASRVATPPAPQIRPGNNHGRFTVQQPQQANRDRGQFAARGQFAPRGQFAARGQFAPRGRGNLVPNRNQPPVRDYSQAQAPPNVHRHGSNSGTSSPSFNADPMAAARELQASRTNQPRTVYTPAGGRGSGSQTLRRPRVSPEKTMIARSGVWAEPPNLLTTQRQREQEAKELEEKLRDVYLLPLEEGADPFGIGYIQRNRTDPVPADLLGGANLPDLNHIRTAYKVWIEWKERDRCIKISSRSEQDHEKRVKQTIVAINDVLDHAKAKAVSLTAIYIAAIPSAKGMRTVVKPREPPKQDDIVKRLELAGDPLTGDAKEAWLKMRSGCVRDANRSFEDQLTTGMLALAPYKGWMRMRIHFGHVEFSRVQNNLTKGKYGFLEFQKMLGNARTMGKFERKLESATIADNVKKRILAWPAHYKPVEGSIETIEEVNFRNTEVIFVSTGGPAGSGTALRIEADIERIHTTNKADEYQIGTRRLFKDNETNKKLEIVTIDVENRVDWAVEVIADNSIEHWPEQILSLIKGSVTTRTKARKDSLGLEYPGVAPVAPWGVYINKTVVRSIIQYKAKETGYIVEIAIYRTWEGDKTSGEPKMASSVSLYHPYWDDEMESIESKADGGRNWDSSLSHFFNYGFAEEGIPALRSEIATVQGFLSAAQSHVDALIRDQREQEGNSD